MPRHPKLTLDQAREIGTRVTANARRKAAAAEIASQVGAPREALLLAILGLEELAKAQVLALLAKSAHYLGRTEFTAYGFYDHESKGRVASHILLDWNEIVSALSEAAGLDVREDKSYLEEGFEALGGDFKKIRENLQYEDVAETNLPEWKRLVEAVVEIVDGYGEWLEWVFSNADFPLPPFPLHAFATMLENEREIPLAEKEKLAKLLGQWRRDSGDGSAPNGSSL